MKQYKVGYAPGVYDMFHMGHLNLIARAKEVSDHLIVGVLTDELAAHYKGRKPYVPYNDRAAIIASLRDVDEVIPVDFTNTDKMDAWNQLHYDAYFSGTDHEGEWDEAKRQLNEVGSDIVFFPYTETVSTTNLKLEMAQDAVKGGMHIPGGYVIPEADIEEKRLYLFGAGKIGKEVLNEIKSNPRFNGWKIAGFLDNDEKKHLRRISGIPIYKPEDLLTLEHTGEYGYGNSLSSMPSQSLVKDVDRSVFAIILTNTATDDTRRQLDELGISMSVVCASLDELRI